MTLEETKKIVDKIKIYRQTFGGHLDKAGMNKLNLEWFRVLEPYDYEDVDKKLDEFLKNGDNFGKYPDVYYLIKYLKKTEEKLKNGVYYVRCNLCGEIVEFDNYDSHYDRCNSADYLCKMSEKYFNQKLNKKKMLEANQVDFEKYYWEFCLKLYNAMEKDNKLKHGLKNAILIHGGNKPEFMLSDLVKEGIK